MAFKDKDIRPLVIAIICGVLTAGFFFFGAFASVQLRMQDLLYVNRHPQPDVVIVAIDDVSLQAIGRWPWDRRVVAQLIRSLGTARIVGLDVNFPEPSNPESDQELADVIAGTGNVVLPVEINYGADGKTPVGALTPIESIRAVAASLAHSNTPPDADGVVRRVPFSVTLPDGTTYHAFGEIVARRAGARVVGVPLDSRGNLLVPFVGAPGTIRTVSAVDVITGAVSAESFRDAIVFVGATAPDLHDERTVPTSNGEFMSGIEIHANVTDALLSRAFVSELPKPYGALIVFALALALGLFIPRVRVRVGSLASLGVIFAYVVVAVIFAARGLFLPLLFPVIGMVITYLAVMVYRYVRTNAERSYLRTAFEKYVSPSVIASLMAHPEQLSIGGERRRMTVLFADLRGFTSLSEHMDPTELVSILNRYFDAMTDIVFEEQGVLDKYMGDAIMAFWGAPIETTDHNVRAIRTALRMRGRLWMMNRDEQFGRGIALHLGIGVSTGEVVVGNMGSSKRFDYTVMGDTVNLGSRVEGLNKEYGTEILATEETVRGLPHNYVVRQLDLVAVKGRTEAVRLYEVIGLTEQMTPEVRDKLDRFSRALALYERGDFRGADLAFADILQLHPHDGPSLLFWQRCTHLQEHPPAEGWNGAWAMHTK